MRGEPTSSDEEKAELTREMGNLQAAEKDAESGAMKALGVLSMMRRTAKKLQARRKKRGESRAIKEQIGSLVVVLYFVYSSFFLSFFPISTHRYTGSVIDRKKNPKMK